MERNAKWLAFLDDIQLSRNIQFHSHDNDHHWSVYGKLKSRTLDSFDRVVPSLPLDRPSSCDAVRIVKTRKYSIQNEFRFSRSSSFIEKARSYTDARKQRREISWRAMNNGLEKQDIMHEQGLSFSDCCLCNVNSNSVRIFYVSEMKILERERERERERESCKFLSIKCSIIVITIKIIYIYMTQYVYTIVYYNIIYVYIW